VATISSNTMAHDNRTKLIYRIWLENSGGKAFGEGPYRLLKGIELTGSLWDAAAGMGMAYSKARRVIQGCEQSLGFSLTHRQVGGASGGSSEVTPQAVELMRAYEALRAEVEAAIAEAYARHFGESVQVHVFVTPAQKRKNIT
jgi:molybdate transport system regulatory protein